jgi:hypothetical protein
MLTEEEIQKYKEEVKLMTHYDMAHLYRFAPAGHPIFSTQYDIFKVFNERFNSFGGMTEKISKEIGWNK